MVEKSCKTIENMIYFIFKLNCLFSLRVLLTIANISAIKTLILLGLVVDTLSAEQQLSFLAVRAENSNLSNSEVYVDKIFYYYVSSPAHDLETSSSEYPVTGETFLNKSTGDLQVTTKNIRATRTSENNINRDVQHSNNTITYISSKEVIDCARDDSVIEFNISYMSIRLDLNSSHLINTCKVRITVPQNLVVRTLIVTKKYALCDGLRMYVTDLGKKQEIFTTCESRTEEIFSFTNRISILFSTWARSTELSSLYLDISSVSPSVRPHLEMKYTSKNQGYIQTPGWDGQKQYPILMDSKVHIPVPLRHNVMISFHEVDIASYTPHCSIDVLLLYKESILKDHLILRVCMHKTPPVTLYNSTELHVHFISKHFFTKTGFRLVFSFHALSALPQQLWDGRWNCSVPHWPHFRLHFPCNLVSDCVGGEDEVDCPYTSDVCAPGFLWTNGPCAQFVKADRKLSWENALEICESRGMVLLSAPTPKDWESLLHLLHFHPYDYTYFGLRAAPLLMPYMYRGGLMWVDDIFAHYAKYDGPFRYGDCFAVVLRKEYNVRQITSANCSSAISSFLLCEVPATRENTLPQMPVVKANWSVDVLQCPSHHMTHTFLACDVSSHCWAEKYDTSRHCGAPLKSLPPSFSCANGHQYVPYTLVCDYRSDCSDDSDERFCKFPSCPSLEFHRCANSQCFLRRSYCNGYKDCLDGSDEDGCQVKYYNKGNKSEKFPAFINIDHEGRLDTFKLPSTLATSPCPETHFQCPGVEFYCLPVYVRCNGVYDCPGKQDETACDTYTCPGYYRCRSSHVCLHPDHVCDGWSQCPEGDDELVCDLSCPDTCLCYGLSFFCRARFLTNNYSTLKFLDAQGSGMSPKDLAKNTMLIYLSLANCNISVLDGMNFVNLNVLDLSNNNIISFNKSAFKTLPSLRSLSMASNPLSSLYPTDRTSQFSLNQLIDLDLSSVSVLILDNIISETFPNIQRLNLSGSGVETVAEQGLINLTKLRSLDMRGCPLLYFPQHTFTSLRMLESVKADSYKVCCPASLPQQFNVQRCEAPFDEISSCDAILRSDIYRVFLSLFAALALVGNIGSFIYRMLSGQKKSNSGFDVFVTNLSIADFVMGVYLAIIGIADRVYLGNYLWNDLIWRNSFVCKLAGFLCLLSSEVSAFIILLVTLDRFLVIRFPFSIFRFFKCSAWIASGIVWIAGVIIALIPLLPSTAVWNFYSQNGICIPIPIIKRPFRGNNYAFGVMVILNGVIFLIIAAGQAFIFWSVKVNSIPNSDTSKKTKDLTIARRLMTVVVSDFCCKFPVALLGLLAARGTPVSSEVIVALVIFIVPLNSALNPFLYTFNVMMEQKRKAREEKLKKYFLSVSEHKIIF